MRHRLGLTLGLALSLTAATHPADPAPPSPEQLIEQLGHRDFKVWEALDKVSAQAGLVLQQHHDAQGGLLLYSQNAYTPYVDYRGPFRLAANSFHYNKSLTFATLPRNQLTGSQRSEQLSFMFSVIA